LIAVELRDFLDQWRLARGWSLQRFADEFGVSQSLVSKWLHPDPRRRVRPNRETLRRMAAAMDVPPLELIRMAGYVTDEDLADTAPRTADPDLAAVNAAWPRLKSSVREAIILLVGAGSRVSDHSTPSYRRANGVSGHLAAFSEPPPEAAEGTSGNAEDGPLSACKPALERSLTLPTVARPQFSPA
jgi:transcriptional regulator with XRE-family HTH domain